MKKLIILLILLSACFAQLKYNPYTNQYENAPDNAQLKYNPYSNQFSYTTKQAELKYNPYNNEYYYDNYSKGYNNGY